MNTTNDIVKNALEHAVTRNALKELDIVKFKNPSKCPFPGDPREYDDDEFYITKIQGNYAWVTNECEDYKVPLSDLVKNAVANAKFKVGDFVFDRNTHRSGTVEKDADKPLVGIKDDFTGKVVFIKSDNLEVRNAKFKVGDKVEWVHKPRGIGNYMGYVTQTKGNGFMTIRWCDANVNRDETVPENEFRIVNNAAPMSAHEASVLLSGKRKAVTQYAKVEPNTLYYRALGGIFAVPESDTMKAAIAAIGSRVLPYQVGGVVGNAAVCNDKWIDQFHVIITKDKPDANLLKALQDKAAAWKIAKRNFSNKEANDAHTKTEDKAYEIAKRLGAKWIQQGAVLKVVMPGNDPYSFNAEK